MSEKNKQKKKVDPKLSQKERFIEYAKAIEADESGELFEKALKEITKNKDVNN
jgi:hypothetical protein